MTSNLPMNPFLSQTACHADMVAIIAADRPSITYGQLLEQLERIGSQLNQLGVGRSERVAIVLPNGPDMAVTFLGVASVATAAPLNPAYRAQEFDFYLSDLSARALIVAAGTDSPAVAVAVARGVPVFDLSTKQGADATLYSLKPRDLTGALTPAVHTGFAHEDDVALVLHTSGTTSRPKIVPLTHRNIRVSAHNVAAALDLTAADRCLNVMPLFHIHGLIAAVLATLNTGGSVVCTGGFDAPRFFGLLARFEPTWYTAVPTMHQAILARAGENRSIIDLHQLRFIRSSSSALPPQVAHQLQQTFGVPVIEAYGMTEAAHQMCSNPLSMGGQKYGSVGVQAGPEVAILCENGRIQQTGEIGEVVIRGDNVTGGYDNNPEANATAFTDGWFCTGDLGYFDADGYLYLTGRKKEIINRGGEKISPREIDEVLLDYPAVAQAVTFAIPDELLGEEIATAVVPREGSEVTEHEIMAFAADRLADFKVPRRVVILDEIPKGPTGKLQRIGLAEKLGLSGSEAGSSKAAAYVEPSTETEYALVQIWREVLGVDRVGIKDNFFQLGGDSILAAMIVTRVGHQMGVELPMLLFFESPTVAGMAAALDTRVPRAAFSTAETEGRQDGEALQPATMIPRRLRSAPIPASFSQQGLWFLDQMDSGNPVYNRPVAVHIDGSLEIGALERSLREIVRRHEALRTVLPEVDGSAVQMLQATENVQLPVSDVCDVPESEREARALKMAVEESRRPFDLAKGPLYRAALFRLGDEKHILLLTIHHAVFDGWSSSVLLRELSALYEGYSAGKPAPLPELPIQYADFAIWQRQRMQGKVVERLRSFWKRQLQSLPLLALPTDRQRPSVRRNNGAVYSLAVPNELSLALKALSRREGTTLFMTLVAVFKALLHRYTKQDDIAVGTDFANRIQVETEPLIGLFVNQLVLRTELSGNPTFQDLLRRVREVVLEAFTHKDLPFDELLNTLRIQRDMSRTPLFQVKIVLQNTLPSPVNLLGLKSRNIDLHNGTAKFDLLLNIVDTARGLRCALEYDTDLFHTSTAVQITEEYGTLLGFIVAHPRARLNALEEHVAQVGRMRRTTTSQELKQTRMRTLKTATRHGIKLENEEYDS